TTQDGRSNASQCGLVAHNQYGLSAVRPVCSGQDAFGGGVRRKVWYDLELAAERLCCLYGASSRADQYAAAMRQVAIQPFRHARRLLLSLGSQGSALVRFAHFRFCMTPQDQFHVCFLIDYSTVSPCNCISQACAENAGVLPRGRRWR